MAQFFQTLALFQILLLEIFGCVSCQQCGEAPRERLKKRFILIKGSVEAKQGAWPWMVAVTKANKRGIQTPWCTGFLVDNTHFISAAHCFDNRQVTLYAAKIGHVDLSQGEDYNVSRIAVPESYVGGSVYDDIAVVTLSREVDVPDFRPLCLPGGGEQLRNLTGRETTVLGWGATKVGGPMSLMLRQLSAMPVVANSECESVYRAMDGYEEQFHRGIPSGIICAGFLHEYGKDSCGGDSGGPLMVQEQDRWYAVGTVGFGFFCGGLGVPGGYTRVSQYLDFINQNLN